MEEPSDIYVNPFKIYMVKAAGNLQKCPLRARTPVKLGQDHVPWGLF